MSQNQNPSLTDDRALFKRLVISYHDLAEARTFLNRLAGLNGEQPPPQEDSIQLDALRVALVVSYSRPFSGNRSLPGVASTLPNRFLEKLTEHERDLHERLIRLRNKEFAHSDPDSADVKVSMSSAGGAPVAIPVSRVTRLDPAGNELDVLNRIFSKMLTAISVEMERIQAKLRPGETF